MALICLKFDVADHRGLPIWRSERAYIRFLQDKGVRVAVIEDENHQHQILIGFLDSLRIRKLHDEAKGSGLLVPELPFNSHIAE